MPATSVRRGEATLNTPGSRPAGSEESSVARDENSLLAHLEDYARANPSAVALWCLGIGFVLGWKLKPW
jgi:hypothetical protein